MNSVMQKKKSGRDLRRWMWIDLIGFDKEAPDYGVGELFAKAGFVPEGVSLLLCSANFVHLHAGVSDKGLLPPECGSYGGHPYNEERKIQQWTQRQLIGLIKNIQKAGSSAYAAIFEYDSSEWIKMHPEMLYVKKTGEKSTSFFYLKRFKDGTYYEDFFIRQLSRVLTDYGFDGYHMADGYAPPRMALSAGDFSDDMAEQFIRMSGAALPSGIAASCDGNPDMIRRRADWLWSQKRSEWISFHVQRNSSFVHHLTQAIHALKKKIVVNSTWTRDPIEAMYRYGVDCRSYNEAGVDAIIDEAASAALEVSGLRETTGGNMFIHGFMVSALLIKAGIGSVPLLWLNGTKDVEEQWNALRHAQPCLEREIIQMENLFKWNEEGNPERAVEGPMVCLADGMSPEEWKWLKKAHDLGFSGQADRLLGVTIALSGNWMDRHLADFVATKRWHAQQIAHRLMALGAPIMAVAEIGNLSAVKGPVVVFHPNLLSEEEMKTVLAYDNGPVVLIGGDSPLIASAPIRIKDTSGPDSLVCAAYGVSAPAALPEDAAEKKQPADVTSASDPESWLDALPTRPVSEQFLRRCADILIAALGFPRAARNEKERDADGIMVMGTEASGTARIIISNDKLGYAYPKIEMGRDIKSCLVLTDFPCGPVHTDSRTSFSVKVPGRGAVVLDVVMEK